MKNSIIRKCSWGVMWRSSIVVRQSSVLPVPDTSVPPQRTARVRPRLEISRFNRIEPLMSTIRFFSLRQDDHDFGGLDQRSSDLALLEPQFTDCLGGNDRSNVLFADREGDLGEQSTDLTVAVRNWSIMVKKIGPPVWLRYELLRVISTAIGPNVDGIRTRSGPLKKVY